MPHIYAGVIVDLRVDAVDRVFQYAVPKQYLKDLQIGHRVLVPFGTRRLEGYVVELSNVLDIEQDRLKSIIMLLDPQPIIQPSLVTLAHWMRQRYAGFLSEALQYMLPPGFRYGKERVGAKKQQMVTLLVADPRLRSNARAQKRVVEVLRQKKQLLASELVEQSQAAYSTLKALEGLGIIAIEEVTLERTVSWEIIPDPPLQLNDDQKQACGQIEAEKKGEGRPVLVHGVTGSGKTEIYLRIIDKVINSGQQAIVLVPEIALTSQTINRFGTRFGPRVTVLHSALSPGERFDQWWKIYRGEVDVVVGARSAVFAPTPNLGLIVLDEEHEGSYKQEEGSIRYHTREVARKRCELVGGQLLLGSATPALESYHLALQGQYKLVELPRRVEARPLPQVEIVDMRREFEAGNRSMFSQPLQGSLTELSHGEEQAIILLNRRGFSSFVLCRECGQVITCPNCQVSLTYHQRDQRLHCHYCQHRTILPPRCPTCASPYLRQFGAGTEQVESLLNKQFPTLKVLRFDADTTRSKGAHGEILKRFSEGEAQVLLGTQMVAKGLDFPNVTLVGVLSADLALNFPDFRSAERTFQLLTQVAGRSGRGSQPGKVIVQAYDPSHFSIRSAQEHDYLDFYRREISYRRQLGYPPFLALTRVLCSGTRQGAEQTTQKIYHYLIDQGLSVKEILGPMWAPIMRIKGRYRWQLIIKSQRPLDKVWRNIPPGDADTQIVVDIDPLYLL